MSKKKRKSSIRLGPVRSPYKTSDKESMDECKAHSGQAVPDLADAALTIVGDWGWLH